jgi:hypothetical protein
MKFVFPSEDEPLDPSWFEPLQLVSATIAGNHRYRFFDSKDFMIMGRVVRSPRPSIVLYKHRFTRRYLNLDDTGRPHRYVAPRDGATGHGRYLVHRDLRAALDHLDLWELPWMKHGLDDERCGLGWDDRWLLHPDWLEEPVVGTAHRTTRGARRGRLRVV